MPLGSERRVALPSARTWATPGRYWMNLVCSPSANTGTCPPMGSRSKVEDGPWIEGSDLQELPVIHRYQDAIAGLDTINHRPILPTRIRACCTPTLLSAQHTWMRMTADKPPCVTLLPGVEPIKKAPNPTKRQSFHRSEEAPSFRWMRPSPLLPGRHRKARSLAGSHYVMKGTSGLN